MKSIKKYSFFICALLFLMIFFSCKVDDTTTGGNAHISVKLTDAPAIYDAVYIDIQSVRIKSSDFTNPATDENGWITINNKPVRVNLLALRNGNTIQLGDNDLKSGAYSQIRLVLGSDNEVVVNGISHTLTTPSGEQSGLKLNINANIKEGEIYNLLVDFDAGRSIVSTGNGNFMLKPVLHAVRLEETGSINGTVEPVDMQTLVLAINKNDTLSTLTDSDGQFSLLGLASGNYDVKFNCKNDAYADTTLANVSVESNKEVNLGTILLDAR